MNIGKSDERHEVLIKSNRILEPEPYVALKNFLENKSPPTIAVLPRVKKLLQDSIEYGEFPPDYDSSDMLNAITVQVLKFVLFALKERFMIFLVVKVFTNYIYTLLNAARARDGRYDASKIIKIAGDLGLSVESSIEQFNGEVVPFRMCSENYLPLTVILKDPHWNLGAQRLRDGYIYLRGNDIAHLLLEYIRQEILEICGINSQELKNHILLDPDFGPFIVEVEDLIQKKRSSLTISYICSHITKKELLFPPCVRAIRQKVTEGTYLTHFERLFLAEFLLNIGYTKEGVVNLYRGLPDFNEKIAWFQVEYTVNKWAKLTPEKARGIEKIRGSLCDKLKKHHLCYAIDPIFGHPWCVNTDPEQESIKNPVDFAERAARLFRE